MKKSKQGRPFIWIWHPGKIIKPLNYHYYIEVNKSFDDKVHHCYSWYRAAFGHLANR